MSDETSTGKLQKFQLKPISFLLDAMIIHPSDLTEDGLMNSEVLVLMQIDTIPQASGSAVVELNKTKVICGIYGPRESQRKSTYSDHCKINCDFKYAPFARLEWSEIKQSEEERELCLMIEQTLSGIILLDRYPKSVIDVYIMVLEDDGGAISTAITAASLALASAGIEMRDLVTSCTTGKVENCLILDPTLTEELYGEANMTVAYMPTIREVSQIIQSGNLKKGESEESIELCIDGCSNIYMLMRQCLIQMSAKNLKLYVDEAL